MKILSEKINCSTTVYSFLTGTGVLLIAFMSAFIVPSNLGKELAEASSAEISYFIKGDNKNLEEQKTLNNKNEEYKENIAIAYPDNKNITVSYDTKKLNNSGIRFTERTLYRIDDPTITHLIKKITLDGNDIPVGYFAFNKEIQGKISQNIYRIEVKPGKHVINIELK